MKKKELKQVASAIIREYDGKTMKPIEFIEDMSNIIGILIFSATTKPSVQNLLFTQLGTELIRLGSAIKQD